MRIPNIALALVASAFAIPVPTGPWKLTVDITVVIVDFRNAMHLVETQTQEQTDNTHGSLGDCLQTYLAGMHYTMDDIEDDLNNNAPPAEINKAVDELKSGFSHVEDTVNEASQTWPQYTTDKHQMYINGLRNSVDQAASFVADYVDGYGS